MSDMLPTECKDLAFARNLIKQMKGEGGRHNSTVSSARVSGTPAAEVVITQNPVGPMASPQNGISSHHYLRFLQFLQQATDTRTTLADIERDAYNQRLESWLTDSARLNGIAWQPPIGRWGNHWIKSEPQFCNVGDACRVAEINDPRDEMHWYGEKPHDWTPTPDSRFWLFKKVATEMIGVYGDAFQTEYFWERVE